MFTGSVDTITNKEDWVSDFYELVDDDDGSVINILNADIGFDCTVYIRDMNGSLLLSGDVADGTVVVSENDDSEAGFQWEFTKTDLAILCAGTYRCGVTIVANGVTRDLIVGSIAVLEGNGN